ncbi:MAG TPA: phospho-sugar mutase [Microthrixaceae bacterium]|nr:phospho-sugar mutase [Microthrixaceae bacterium]
MIADDVIADDQLVSRVERWIAIDPDPVTRTYLRAILDRGSAVEAEELEHLFGTRITFGTAGIRGPLGPGPSSMNRVVVRHTAAGVARELLMTVPDARRRGVVVGHDARHGSATFAADIVEVLRAHGFAVSAFGASVPTPLLAFAVGYLHTAAGIMVTASHNPAADNGMKVYWEDGAQIIPPVDGQIAAHFDSAMDESLTSGIDATTESSSILEFCRLLGEGLGLDNQIHQVEVHRLGDPASGDPLVSEYLRQGLLLASSTDDATPHPLNQRLGSVESATKSVPRPRGIRIAVTSLHGVGAVLLHRLLSDAGYDDIHMVESQRLPDPDFPTVAFPNPEEPGALDQVLNLAEKVDADVAIANDPDADRLAAAFRESSGDWRVLRGDELGALLAHRLLEMTSGIPNRLLATTVVSSRLTARMAEDAGVEFRETLTGFKWLCRAGLADPSIHQVLLYEEALGYAVGPRVRDKDGITAALVLMDLVCHLKNSGTSVWETLDELAVKHGAHVQRNSSIRFHASDWAVQAATMIERIIAAPPNSLAGYRVSHSDRPAPDVLRFFLDDGTRAVVRPSGTEPKVKLYCEAIEPVRTSGTANDPESMHLAVISARQSAAERLELVEAHLQALLMAPA